MKEFELSHEAVANLDEEAEQRGLTNEDRDDPVEQSLEVPTERPEDEAAEYVQKEYKEKSGLELDEESARDIVSTARAGDSGESSDSESDSNDDRSDDDRSDKDSAKDDSAEDSDKPD